MTSASVAVRSVARAPTRERYVGALFVTTVFVAACLLFLVQPMIAKGLLPIFGGTPAVWTTAMLFFQAALLGGYALAHLTLQRLGPRRQSRVQLVVLAVALVALPIAAPDGSRAGDPLLSLLLLLATGIGLPFLALSTASPVLQRWFSVSGHSRAGNPYVLYVASNIGSLAALLAYPFIVEPNLTLESQRLAWSALYVGFVILSAACALVLFPPTRTAAGATPRPADGVPREPAAAEARSTARPIPVPGVWRERLTWLGLAFVPSSLMLGVTTFLTTDIASAPLLWVAPLSLYLLSFIVAFSRWGLPATRAAGIALPFLAVAAAIDMFGSIGLPVALRLPLHLGVFTVAAVLCHGRLAASRPRVERLTEFYLLLAVGGVTGGLVNAVLAPSLVDVVIEYPLVMGAALLARRRMEGSGRRRWTVGAVAFAIFAAIALVPWSAGFLGAWSSPALVILMSLPLIIFSLPVPFAALTTVLLSAGILLVPPPLLSERNFFGLFRVVETGGEHLLVHGTTIHGREAWPPDAVPQASGYYHPAGPMGDVLALRDAAGFRRVAILGLGTGGMAAHFGSGQELTFYEIDPAIADVAADRRYFTYLPSARASLDIQIGDGRLLLAEEPPAAFDLLMMDAFSSDSVPTHLLTREAFEMYFDRLAPDGILVVHISNRYLDLGPVVSAAARDLGVVAWERRDPGADSVDVRERRQPSRYLALARHRAPIEGLADRGWHVLPATDRPAWTDAFSDIVSIVDWGGDLLR